MKRICRKCKKDFEATANRVRNYDIRCLSCDRDYVRNRKTLIRPSGLPIKKRSQALTAEQRFWEYVMAEPNTGCWVWMGPVDRQGYGRFKHDCIHRSAHRFSFEIHKGPVPPRLFVCHQCDHPWCVNPDHLWAGTARDNNLDSIAKGRRKRRDSKSGGLNHG